MWVHNRLSLNLKSISELDLEKVCLIVLNLKRTQLFTVRNSNLMKSLTAVFSNRKTNFFLIYDSSRWNKFKFKSICRFKFWIRNQFSFATTCFLLKLNSNEQATHMWLDRLQFEFCFLFAKFVVSKRASVFCVWSKDRWTAQSTDQLSHSLTVRGPSGAIG